MAFYDVALDQSCMARFGTGRDVMCCLECGQLRIFDQIDAGSEFL
jgi:hypothetical protein